MGVDNIANGNTVIRRWQRSNSSLSSNLISITFYRGRSQSVHQLKLPRIAEGNEAGATNQTDAGHTQLYGSPVRQDSPG